MVQFDEDKEKKRLEELRKTEEEELVRVLSESKYGIPYVNLAGLMIENDALRAVPEADARARLIAPFKILGKTLSLAVRSPEKDETKTYIQDLESRGYSITPYMASMASLEKVWSRYSELSFASTSRSGGLDISSEMLTDLRVKIHSIDDIIAAVKESSTDKAHRISHMLEIILAGATAVDASDIHIEPEEKEVHLRFRLDGVLENIMTFGYDVHKLLNSRIKLISGLKLTSVAVAQDGRFSFFEDGAEINLRVSVIPGAYGESIVMRILNPKSIAVQLEELGIPENLYAMVSQEIKKPNGLILLTGPTGSGKTTTLYAFLKKIYSPEIKVITIEDPIEYHLPGITQTQVETEKGYTFLEGLRSALRQDPDVIMVGEIRDDETAKIAIESALTGHLVFSTLHTNNAGGVIPRLIDLAVNPKILPSALSLSMGQRLVRKLCPKCKKEKIPTDEEKKKIVGILQAAIEEGKDIKKYGVAPDDDILLWEPVGCDFCHKSGFKGRLGIFEAIKTDEAIEKIIVENPSEREIKKMAEKQGYLDLKEDGIIKVLKGITSLAEVASVVDLDED